MRVALICLLLSGVSLADKQLRARVTLLLSKPRTPTVDEFVKVAKSMGANDAAVREAFDPKDGFNVTLAGRVYRVRYEKGCAYSNRFEAVKWEKDPAKRKAIRKHLGFVTIRANRAGDLREHYERLARFAAAMWGDDVMGVRFSWILVARDDALREKLRGKSPLEALGVAMPLLKQDPEEDPVDIALRMAAFEAWRRFPEFKRAFEGSRAKKGTYHGFSVYLADAKKPRGVIRVLVKKIRAGKIEGYRVTKVGDVEKYDPAREVTTAPIHIVDWSYRHGDKTIGAFRRAELVKRGLPVPK